MAATRNESLRKVRDKKIHVGFARGSPRLGQHTHELVVLESSPRFVEMEYVR